MHFGSNERAQVLNLQIKKCNDVYSSFVFSYRERTRRSICNRLKDQTAAVGLHVRKSAFVVQVLGGGRDDLFAYLCLK